MARTEGLLPDIENNEYWIFHGFSQKLRTAGSSLQQEWLQIKQTFMELEEWFEDRVLYHIVGFLVSEGMSIAAIRELSKHCTKSEFGQKLRREAFAKTIGGQLPEDIDEVPIRARVGEKLDRTRIRLAQWKDQINPVALQLGNTASEQAVEPTIPVR